MLVKLKDQASYVGGLSLQDLHIWATIIITEEYKDLELCNVYYMLLIERLWPVTMHIWSYKWFDTFVSPWRTYLSMKMFYVIILFFS